MLVLGVGFKLDAHAAWLISTDADVTVLLITGKHCRPLKVGTTTSPDCVPTSCDTLASADTLTALSKSER